MRSECSDRLSCICKQILDYCATLRGLFSLYIFAFTRVFCWKETLFPISAFASVSFFMQLSVYPVTVFCLGMLEMHVSHMCETES